jgi:hypothetical protein
MGLWYWDSFIGASTTPVAWISNRRRFFGVGAQQWLPNERLEEGEFFIAVELPWTGCGDTLAKGIDHAEIAVKGNGPEYLLRLDDHDCLKWKISSWRV